MSSVGIRLLKNSTRQVRATLRGYRWGYKHGARDNDNHPFGRLLLRLIDLTVVWSVTLIAAYLIFTTAWEVMLRQQAGEEVKLRVLNKIQTYNMVVKGWIYPERKAHGSQK